LLNQTIFWISPFGNSLLVAPPAVASGSSFPITLTLNLARDLPQPMTAEVTLPEEASIVPDSLSGGWIYFPITRTLSWQGSLSPDTPLPLSVEVELEDSIPEGAILPIRARFYDSRGLVVVSNADMVVGIPWVSIFTKISPTRAKLEDMIFMTLTVENQGVAQDSISITETWPVGLELISDTLTTTLGSTGIIGNGFNWQSQITPGETLTLTCQARITLPRSGAWLKTRTDLSTTIIRRMILDKILVPMFYYLPLAFYTPPG
jgi:hypothetical protein